MEPSPEPRETISRFEKLLTALATNPGEKDKLDVLAMREILAREGGG